MNEGSVTALVPMRHHSQRVPGKNYRPLAGVPLYHHVLRSLQASSRVGQIVIDTDSPTIVADCRRHFPEVALLERPEHLRPDKTPMHEVLLHDADQVPADFYLQTHSTNPLLSSATIDEAVATFFEEYPSIDSLFSVTRLQTRLWDGSARPLNHDPAILLRTQDLPPLFVENSCLYVFPRQTLKELGRRIGDRPYLFEMEAEEAHDIDDELDFKIAEFLVRQRQQTDQGG